VIHMTQNCIDHTKEVGKRIAAIKTSPRDICSFYQPHDMCIAAIKECWYCRYASFDFESKDTNKDGFCKFKKF
jgi:hypothetical protein